MAKRFSDGRFVTGLVGAYFVAIADAAVIPQGWSKMDGGFIPGQGLATFPDFAGKYIRGGTFAAVGAQGGNKTHNHILAGTSNTGQPTYVFGEGSPPVFTNINNRSHSLAADTTNESGDLQTSGSIMNPNSGHTHLTSSLDHAHTHVTSTVSDPASSIPLSRVIDWIGKKASQTELNAYPLGAILGMFKDVAIDPAKVPKGWQLCDGTNGVPNLLSKFTSEGGAAGSDTHVHSIFESLTTPVGGQHTHTITDVSDSVGSVSTIGPGSDLAQDNVHGHGDVFDDNAIPNHEAGKHIHPVNVGFDVPAEDHKPPFVEMPYIVKIVETNDNTLVPLDIHIFWWNGFVGAPLRPIGWGDAGVNFDARLLVGRLVLDPDFGSLGNIGVDTHLHDLTISFASAGSHTHSSVGQRFVDPGSTGGPISSGVTMATNLHTHTLTGVSTSGAHTHPDVTDRDSDTVNHRPASEATDIQVVKKT